MPNHLEVCRTCGASCCKMGGTDFDEEERERLLTAGFPDHLVRIADGHYETSTEDGRCPYLSEDLSCTIHAVRPRLCRRWPVFTEVVKGEKRHCLVHCPITEHLNEKDIAEMRLLADEVPSHFLAESIKSSKLSKKDLTIINKRFDRFRSARLE